MAQTYSAQVDGEGFHSKLNPFAKEWIPSVDGGSESARSLFFTFAAGSPIKSSEISKFFNEKYGECVERVILLSKHRGETPLSGKVVFKTCTIPALIISGKDQVKFMIDDKSLWCRKYNRKKNRKRPENGGQSLRSPASCSRREARASSSSSAA